MMDGVSGKIKIASWGIVLVSFAVILFPIYLALIASTHTSQEIVQAPMSLLPGGHFVDNLRILFTHKVGRMLWISFFVAIGISVGKVVISLLSAFSFVYFDFAFKNFCFWFVFATLMLPVEVRITSTYQVVSKLGMVNTYGGLILPLIASATGTFLFRQFFMSVPRELSEAARLDGAGPLRFFRDILLPLSRSNIAALFIIQFIYGWNQYLWPIIATTQEDMYPLVIGIKRLIVGGDSATHWDEVMILALFTVLPPTLIVILMQRWIRQGLIDSEK